MPLSAGRLRHRIDIEQQEQVQDPDTGQLVVSWVPVWQNVPAAVEPLSVREFIAAKGVQSEVSVRVVIRHRDGLNASMRIRHKGQILNPAGFLADPTYGLEFITIPCSAGVNDGETVG